MGSGLPRLEPTCCSWRRSTTWTRIPTMTSSILSALILPILVASVAGDQRAAENRLMSSLLANYNSMFIPVLNSSVPIVVNMETMLKKIVEYDYEKGILTSMVWLDFQWMDDYLQWNPEEFEGITQIQLPPNKVWTPDIFLFNAGDLDLRPVMDTMDLEGYTGSSIWDLAHTSVTRHETMYDCCPDPFVDLTFTIRFHKVGKVVSMFKSKGWGL